MNKIFSSILLIFTYSCQAPSRVKANFELLQEFSHKEQEKEPFISPYIATYTKGAKILKFIAANHESNIESGTFKTVKAIIENFKPEIMILEGFHSTEEISPKYFIDKAIECEKGSFQKCNERSYAIYLGQKTKIPFTSGEPTELNILKSILEKGYTSEDLVGFYLVRAIPQWKRQKLLENQDIKDIRDKIKIEGNKQLEIFGKVPNYSWVQFNLWYEEKLGNKFELEKISSNDVAPRIDGQKITFLNKISNETGIIRELSIAQKIEKMLNQYNRVMVLYGNGHIVRKRKFLQDMLGDPKNEKLY